MNIVPNAASRIARHPSDPKVVKSGPRSISGTDSLVSALGWFSIGLGLTELLAPGRMTRALGMEGREGLIRAYGAREIVSGVMALSPEKRAGLWSRVAGDVIDLATLLPALRDDNRKRDNVAGAIAMVAGITVLDVVAAQGTAVQHSEKRGERRLYRDRSGFPQGVAAARGAARDFAKNHANPASRTHSSLLSEPASNGLA